MMNKGVLVYNPISHGGKLAAKAVGCVRRVYAEKGIGLVVHAIDPAGRGFGDLADVIGREKADHVIVSGGDGTLGRYLQYAVDEGIGLPIGIVPTGTANDYAGSLGIPSDIGKAVERIAGGTPRECDTARIGGRCFINVFSSGYLTCVSHTTPDGLKKMLGRAAYFVNGMREVFSPSRRMMRIVCDGQAYEGPVLLVLVLNGRTAGRMRFAPEADVTDGKLDVRIFTGKSLAGTLAAAVRVLFGVGLQGCGSVVCMKGGRISMEGERHMTDVDGDPGPDYPLEVECMRGRLKVIL